MQQKLLAGPRFAFHRLMCTRMCDLGLSLEFPDLAQIGIATQVRLAHDSAAFPKIRGLILGLSQEDEFHPARMRRPR
eukprot:6264751-Pyramimonas_sp.AAC.1